MPNWFKILLAVVAGIIIGAAVLYAVLVFQLLQVLT